MTILRPKKPFAGRAQAPRRSLDGSSRSRFSFVSRLPLKRFPGRWWQGPMSWRKRAWYIAGAVALFGVILAVGVVAWVSQDLPDPNKLSDRSVAQSTKIYARDGSTLLYEIHGEERRTLVELNEIGKYTKDATLSIEDKSFYQHSGISLRGMLRALFVDVITGTKSQGGSTITQQLVKNAILTSEKTVTRKVKEVILSYQIERRFTKDQILKLYFNEIPYGSNAYGIEAAAETYFNKRAKDLDLAESALLAAILPAPSYYSPRGSHTDEVVARWKLVLDTMVREKKITKAQADTAKKIDILGRISPTRDRVVAPHFVFYVRDYLEKKYGTALLERGGLRVTTTLDPELQRIAEEEVKTGAEKNERHNASNVALVAIEPKSGQLLAMVGSRDFFDTDADGNFNVATSIRNPGSSFKPIVYLSAFMKGYSPKTILFDVKTSFGPDGSGKDFSPNNYDLSEHGPLPMRNTLAGSLNIPAVKTLYLAGIPATIDVAEKLGYTTFDRTKLGLALAIGGGGVRLIEHTSAFATLANDGVRNPTTPILRVEDARGKILELYKEQSERVIPEQPVRELNDVLSDNGARAFVFGTRNSLTLPGRSVAAKTGTTNDFVDGWTMGFTPQLAAGVWVGNNDNSQMGKGADGSVVAAPIWNAFMRRVVEGDPVQNFSKPKSVETDRPMLNGKLSAETKIIVDSQTGKQIPESCVEDWPDQFKKTITVREVHTILHYVQKDDPLGDPPSKPTNDPMYERWEAPVLEWAKANKYVTTAPAMERCSLRVGDDALSISITSPEANATISSATLDVSVSATAQAGVSAVAYYIDDVLLATSTTAPYGGTLDLSGVENGFRVLRAVLTNTSGQTTEAAISINILSNQSSVTLYFIEPSPNTFYSLSDFPVTVRVFAHDPAGVDTVTLSMKKPDGKTEKIDEKKNPSSTTVSFTWTVATPGSYELYFQLKNDAGKTQTSDRLPVTVTF